MSNINLDNLEAALKRIQVDTSLLHKIVHGSATETVKTDGGDVKTAAKTIADLSDIVNKLLAANTQEAKELKDKHSLIDTAMVRAPDEMMGKLGLAGFTKGSKTLQALPGNNIDTIDKNSAYSYTTGTPAVSGIVYTLVANDKLTYQMIATQATYAFRYKIDGKWQQFKNTLDPFKNVKNKGDMLYYDGTEFKSIPRGNPGEGLIVNVKNEYDWMQYTHITKDIPDAHEVGVGPYKAAGFLDSNNYFWFWGENNYGQLADEHIAVDITNRSRPYKVKAPLEFDSIKKWNWVKHTQIMLLNTGKVLVWGLNNNHIVGPGPGVIATMTELKFDEEIVDFYINPYCGDDKYGGHTLFLTKSGKVYATGVNTYGELGLGTLGNVIKTPTLVKLDFKVKLIYACGGVYGRSYVISEAGDLYGTGYNYFSDLGTGDKGHKNTFTKIKNSSQPDDAFKVKLISSSSATYASTGHYRSHTVITTASSDGNDKIYVWGYNNHGQLGIGTNESKSSPFLVKTFHVGDGSKNVNGGTIKKVLATSPTKGGSIVLFDNGHMYGTGYSSGIDGRRNGLWHFRKNEGTSNMKPLPSTIWMHAGSWHKIAPDGTTKHRHIIDFITFGGINNQSISAIDTYGNILAGGYNEKHNIGEQGKVKKTKDAEPDDVIPMIFDKALKMSFVGYDKNTCLSYMSTNNYYQAGAVSLQTPAPAYDTVTAKVATDSKMVQINVKGTVLNV